MRIPLLTHFSQSSYLWDMGKQCRPRSDTAYADQDLHTVCIKNVLLNLGGK